MTYTASATPPKANSFTKKQIIITFYTPQADGSFSNVTIGQNHAIHALIKHAGVALGSEAEITIKGLIRRTRDNFSIVPDYPMVDDLNHVLPGRTTIMLSVSDDNNAPLTTLFIGQINDAYTDYNDPDTPFQIHAMTNTIPAGILIPAKGYKGPYPALSILQDICYAAKLQLLNYGGWDHHQTLTNHYRSGTALDQIKGVVNATHIHYNFKQYTPITQDETNNLPNSYKQQISQTTAHLGVIEIWGGSYTGTPPNGQEKSIPIISAQNGMVGYPKYNEAGTTITTLLRPDIAFWQPLILESKYAPQNWLPSPNQPNSLTNQSHQLISKAPWDGLWLPIAIQHEVSTEMQEGKWHTTIDCIRTNLGQKPSHK
ncbi:hypothetical protein GM556_01245 [Bombella sp. ESL0378]|uniref:hypothetical protein n=1 Tax=Bombella sp. ESL0378 TaxID=2676442 RepID=UPI0012D91FB8|nr:hypothetical protein [Bombella sp. ESL0378]MUG04172.1 hypothetical protein [Bombella sp. ESL0378]